MKHGKRPTVQQRKLLEREGLNWTEWLIVKNLPNSIIVAHRETNEMKVVEK